MLRSRRPKRSRSARIPVGCRRTTRISIPILATYDAAPDRSREAFVAIDLYFISLFRYTREGGEKRWSFLRFFQFASGVGELDG